MLFCSSDYTCSVTVSAGNAHRAEQCRYPLSSSCY